MDFKTEIIIIFIVFILSVACLYFYKKRNVRVVHEHRDLIVTGNIYSTSQDESVEIRTAEPDTDKFLSQMKKAVDFKKQKHFDEACEILKDLFKLFDSPSLEHRLRLPMYLQLAGRNDEAWGDFQKIGIKYISLRSMSTIANQKRIFLQKEKKDRPAILEGAWAHVCKSKDDLLYTN